jgi:hypothetical protein
MCHSGGPYSQCHHQCHIQMMLAPACTSKMQTLQRGFVAGIRVPTDPLCASNHCVMLLCWATVMMRVRKQTLEERLRRKDCHEEKTAPGAAGSEGGVTGKLKASSSSDLLVGEAGSGVLTGVNLHGRQLSSPLHPQSSCKGPARQGTHGRLCACMRTQKLGSFLVPPAMLCPYRSCLA